MLTGTPLDLTPYGSLLGVIGLAYWALGVGLVALALWLPKRVYVKVPLATLIAAVFVTPVATLVASNTQKQETARSKLDAAMSLFRERCKASGERVFRIVEHVEGIVWMRPRDASPDLDDQFQLEDPYGFDCFGEGCFKRFLRISEGASMNPEEAARYAGGYSFVEVVSSLGNRFRYTAYMKAWTPEQAAVHRKVTGEEPPARSNRFAMRRETITEFKSRYGVVWDDISLPEDRRNWIAGGVLKVLDLQTNEVVAERVGYMIDRLQGDRSGFRSPWSWARTNGPKCPEKTISTAKFVSQVLIPAQ